MELDKLHQQWNSFPEMSMEERPVLSTDLEKMVALGTRWRTPSIFKKKLITRIIAFTLLWLADGWLVRAQWLGDRKDIYFYCRPSSCCSAMPSSFISGFSCSPITRPLLGLPLVPFLGKTRDHPGQIHCLLQTGFRHYRIQPACFL